MLYIYIFFQVLLGPSIQSDDFFEGELSYEAHVEPPTEIEEGTNAQIIEQFLTTSEDSIVFHVKNDSLFSRIYGTIFSHIDHLYLGDQDYIADHHTYTVSKIVYPEGKNHKTIKSEVEWYKTLKKKGKTSYIHSLPTTHYISKDGAHEIWYYKTPVNVENGSFIISAKHGIALRYKHHIKYGTLTYEIKRIHQRPVNPSIFALPEHYERKTLKSPKI